MGTISPKGYIEDIEKSIGHERVTRQEVNIFLDTSFFSPLAVEERVSGQHNIFGNLASIVKDLVQGKKENIEMNSRLLEYAVGKEGEYLSYLDSLKDLACRPNVLIADMVKSELYHLITEAEKARNELIEMGNKTHIKEMHRRSLRDALKAKKRYMDKVGILLSLFEREKRVIGAGYFDGGGRYSNFIESADSWEDSAVLRVKSNERLVTSSDEERFYKTNKENIDIVDKRIIAVLLCMAGKEKKPAIILSNDHHMRLILNYLNEAPPIALRIFIKRFLMTCI